MNLSGHMTINEGRLNLDLRFDLPLQGITAITGPTGAGKTTFLHWIAGLRAVSGELWIGNERIDHIPAGRRGIGLVFQDAYLFQHQTVEWNLRYAQRRGRGAIADLRERLGIAHLGHVRDLSGGERQLVAIACALLTGPRLLLLDEPLSGLDRALRQKVMTVLCELKRDLPMVLVSHCEVEGWVDRAFSLKSFGVH